MSWSTLALQFSLELAFGVLLALAFVPKAPVGVLFYRLMGGAVLVPLVLAILLATWVEGRAWTDPVVVGALLASLLFPIYATGPMRASAWWWAGLGLGTGSTAAAVGLLVRVELARHGAAGLFETLLGTTTALATGTVAGSVGLAMVLGHWYLTVPKLSIEHLRRLNRVTVFSMLACLGLLGLSCAVFRAHLGQAEMPLLGPWGLFYLGTRAAVGLVLPLVFAWMTADSLKYGNTRSATGILYASTVLVLIGAAVSMSLQDSYGVPL